jgi:restriction endonuclease S subunit
LGGDTAWQAPLANANLRNQCSRYSLRLAVSNLRPVLFFSTHFYSRIMQMTAKSSVDSVRREMIARMLVPHPSTRKEQTAIATVLSDMDADIAVLENKLVKARQVK